MKTSDERSSKDSERPTGGHARANDEEAPVSKRRTRGGEGGRSRALLDFADELTPMERWQIDFVQHSFDPGPLDRTIRVLQRHIGSNWIEASIRHLREVHGTERLPAFDRNQSYILVSNHRSFFDLYVVTGYLVKRGMPHRLVFPVRSKFFYDSAAGFFVNGVMSFFAMYPPVFRERHRAALNLASLDEVGRLLQRGGSFVGLHPEGMRGQGDDPYTLLPAQSGVGRIIQAARVPVIPVFINGLGNDIVKQVGSNYMRNGKPVRIVFGAPVDFGDMLEGAPSPRLHRKISERALEAIRALGEEERALEQASRAKPSAG